MRLIVIREDWLLGSILPAASIRALDGSKLEGNIVMGLALDVGILADLRENDEEGYEFSRSQFDALNQYLQQINLPSHTEPEDCEVWSCEMFGYSGLHYLRRLAAHLDLKGELPAPGTDESAEDPVLNRYYQLAENEATDDRGFDHLILHSDAEGYYLPLDFKLVLFPDESLEIAGGMVGSCYRLLSECERIAAALEIPANLDENSEELWEAADSQGEGEAKWERYGIESFSCVCLIQGCRKSIETGAALVFT